MQTTFTISTTGPSMVEFTGQVGQWLEQFPARDGLLTLMIRHTSASLMIMENADPDVPLDMMAYLNRLAPRADQPEMGYLRHRYEGPDDMPAHIKAALLPVTLSIPVMQGRMRLGTWQGIFLVEHRDRPHRRDVAAHLLC